MGKSTTKAGFSIEENTPTLESPETSTSTCDTN